MQQPLILEQKEKKVEAAMKKLEEALQDKNKDRKITKVDLPESYQKKFDSMDKNKDGKIDEKEKKDYLFSVKDKLLNGKKSAGGGSSKKKKKKKKPSES